MPIEPLSDPGFSSFGFVLGFAALAFGLVVLIGIKGAQRKRRVEEGRQAVAAAQGWSHTESGDEWVDRYPVPPFGLGYGRRAGNVVSGRYRGAPFASFDYSYSTGNRAPAGDSNAASSSTRHAVDVAVLTLGLPLPDLHLMPSGGLFGTRIVSGVAGSRVRLDDPAFNDAFTVVSADERLAFDVFGPATIRYLMGHRDLAFSIVEGDVVLSRQARGEDTVWGPGDPAVPMERSDAPFDQVLTVLAGIPEFVWADRGGLPVSLRGILR